MLLQKVKKICKRDVITVVERDDGTQWLGGLGAIYPVFGIGLNEKSVCTLFDLPEEDDDRIFRDYSESELKGVTLDDVPDDGEVEKPLVPIDWTIQWRGTTYEPFMGSETSDGLVLLVDADYLAPLKDCENLGFYARRKDSGEWYVAAKNGYQIVAAMAAEKIADSARIALSFIVSHAESVADSKQTRGSIFYGYGGAT